MEKKEAYTVSELNALNITRREVRQINEYIAENRLWDEYTKALLENDVRWVDLYFEAEEKVKKFFPNVDFQAYKDFEYMRDRVVR